MADGVPACLLSTMLGELGMRVSVRSVAVAAAPDGETAETVAVLATWSASTSTWVRWYVAVHVVVAAGARTVTGQDTGPAVGSSIAIAVSVTLPVFVTMKL